MAVQVNSSSPQLKNIPLTVEEVRERLSDKIVESIQAIVRDNMERMSQYKTDTRVLGKGVYYTMDYFNALEEKKQSKRLDHLRNNDSFYHGYASSEFFKMVPDQQSATGKMLQTFVLQRGSASEALKSIREGFSLIDCTGACEIAQYTAIESILGTEKFDALFRADLPWPLTIGTSNVDSPLPDLRIFTKDDEDHSVSIFRKGDLIAHRNIGRYLLKHPFGLYPAFSTIFLGFSEKGEAKYTTLGLPSEGATAAEIQDAFIEGYNQPPKEFNALTPTTLQKCFSKWSSALVRKINELKDDKITQEDFRELGGSRVRIHCELHAERITTLANSSINDAIQLINSWRQKGIVVESKNL